MAERKKILLVDDDRNALATLTKILSEDGYIVVAAGTEAQAVSRLNKWNFDFIITDLFLFRKSCVNLLNSIKELERSIPVILTSGYAEVARHIDEPHLLDMRPLSKPIDYDKLKKLIGKIEAQYESGAREASDYANSVGTLDNHFERVMPSG